MVRDNRPGWQAEPPNATPRVGRSGAGVAVEVHAVAALVLCLQFARLAWPGLLQVGVVHGLNQPVLRADDLLGLTQSILDLAHEEGQVSRGSRKRADTSYRPPLSLSHSVSFRSPMPTISPPW